MNAKLLELLSNYNISSIKDNILNNKVLTIKEIDNIEEAVKKNNPLDIENILYSIMLEVAIYNSRQQGMVVDALVEPKEEIVAKKNISWDDILTYLEIKHCDISPLLKEEMEKCDNLKNVEITARFIKNSRKVENRIINKINDVDIIICILLYSSKKHISNIINYFRNENEIDGRALGKAIEAIPSIFLVGAPEAIPSNYDLFIKNYELLKENDIEVRNIIINKPIMMISSDLDELINSIRGVI